MSSFYIKINEKEKIEFSFPGCLCCSYIEGIYGRLKSEYPKLKHKNFDLCLKNKILYSTLSYSDSGIKPGDILEVKINDKLDNDFNENEYYIDIIINENDKMKVGHEENDKIIDLKEKIKDMIGLNIENQELIFNDNVLEDDDKLIKNLNIKKEEKIRLKIILN